MCVYSSEQPCLIMIVIKQKHRQARIQEGDVTDAYSKQTRVLPQRWQEEWAKSLRVCGGWRSSRILLRKRWKRAPWPRQIRKILEGLAWWGILCLSHSCPILQFLLIFFLFESSCSFYLFFVKNTDAETRIRPLWSQFRRNYFCKRFYLVDDCLCWYEIHKQVSWSSGRATERAIAKWPTCYFWRIQELCWAKEEIRAILHGPL